MYEIFRHLTVMLSVYGFIFIKQFLVFVVDFVEIKSGSCLGQDHTEGRYRSTGL